MPCSNNDINVVLRIPLIVNYLHRIASHAKLTINGHEYNFCYFLADRTNFQKTINSLKGDKQKWYVKMKEATKDIERAF